jgi:hypothetical protein
VTDFLGFSVFRVASYSFLSHPVLPSSGTNSGIMLFARSRTRVSHKCVRQSRPAALHAFHRSAGVPSLETWQRAGYTRRLTAHGGKRTPARAFGFSTGSKSTSAGPCWTRTARWWFIPSGRPRSYTPTGACRRSPQRSMPSAVDSTIPRKAALAELLRRTIAADPFPMSPRVRQLRTILAKPIGAMP